MNSEYIPKRKRSVNRSLKIWLTKYIENKFKLIMAKIQPTLSRSKLRDQKRIAARIYRAINANVD